MKPYYEDETTTIYLADNREALPCLEGGSVGLIATDPPYNVSKPDAVRGNLRGAGRNAGTFDFGAWDANFDPLPYCKEFARLLSPDGQAYVFSSSALVPDWCVGMRGEFQYKLLSWVKPDPLPSLRQRHWVSASEHVLWFWRGRYVFNFLDHVRMFSWKMMQSPKGAEERFHKNQKPLALLLDYIGASSAEGAAVLDPFMGSGTTGVACAILKRQFVGVETEQGDCDVAVARIKRAKLIPCDMPRLNLKPAAHAPLFDLPATLSASEADRTATQEQP